MNLCQVILNAMPSNVFFTVLCCTHCNHSMPDVRQECKGCLQTQLHFLLTIQLFRGISAQWRTGSSCNSLRNIDQSVHPSERTFTHPSLERPLKCPSVHSSSLICHPSTLTCNNYSSIHQFKHLSIYPPIDQSVCGGHLCGTDSQEGRPNPKESRKCLFERCLENKREPVLERGGWLDNGL